MNKTKSTILIVGLIVILAFIAVGGYLIYKFTPKTDAAPSPGFYEIDVGRYNVYVGCTEPALITSIDADAVGENASRTSLYIYSLTASLYEGYIWSTDTITLEFEARGTETITNCIETLTREGNVWYFDDPYIYNAGNAPTSGDPNLGVVISFPSTDLVSWVGVIGNTLTFDANGGSVSSSTMEVTNGENVGTLPTPTRDGYRFDGWYVDGVKINSGDVWNYTEDKTAIAQWTQIYTLTLNANSGTVNPSTMSVINGESIGTLPTPSRAGYRFNGWYIDGVQINSGDVWNYTENKTATAQWIQQFTLTIQCSDTSLGSITNAINNQTYDANTQFISTASVTAIGYSLLYWQDDLGNKIYENPLNITLTRNSTYTAVFGKSVELNGICAIDINLLGGITANEVVGYVAMSGYATNEITTVHLWAMASKGYKFEYWTIDGEILMYNETSAYTDVCDLPIELVQGKVVVANFSKISNNNVNEDLTN